jgi:hypothetical protein
VRHGHTYLFLRHIVHIQPKVHFVWGSWLTIGFFQFSLLHTVCLKHPSDHVPLLPAWDLPSLCVLQVHLPHVCRLPGGAGPRG